MSNSLEEGRKGSIVGLFLTVLDGIRSMGRIDCDAKIECLRASDESALVILLETCIIVDADD